MMDDSQRIEIATNITKKICDSADKFMDGGEIENLKETATQWDLARKLGVVDLVDQMLQYIAEREMKAAMERFLEPKSEISKT